MRLNLAKKQYARDLRKNQTDVEKLLWYRLRNRQIADSKFKRQQVIEDYIVDFVNFDKKIIVELDGGQHNTETNIEYDRKRTEYLEKNGFKVLRFWNNEVTKNMEGVLERIHEEVIKP